MKGIMQGMQVQVFENSGAMLLEAQMADDLRHDFSPRTCRHGLLHKIARHIDEQSIAPEDLDSSGWPMKCG